MTRSAKAGIGAVLALVLAFGVWKVVQREPAVFESSVPAVHTPRLHPPQYAAQLTYDAITHGMVLRAGDHEVKLPRSRFGVWLADGRYLLWSGSTQAFDPRSGKLTAVPAIDAAAEPKMPGEAFTRLALPANKATRVRGGKTVISFAPDLDSYDVLPLPQYDGDVSGMYRNFGNRVFSVGDWDYVHFGDTTSESDGDYGYLRRHVGSSRWQKVLLDQPIASLWVSSDGRALLAVLEKTGHHPCAGCRRAQQIVEIDPAEAKIVRTYGAPDGYDRSWRVSMIDKVGDRVLVRYISHGQRLENRGVWQYDGDWSFVRGTDGPFTWWQGPNDRIEAQAPKTTTGSGQYVYTLYWVHGERRTKLTGFVLRDYVDGWRGIPGSLVPLK